MSLPINNSGNQAGVIISSRWDEFCRLKKVVLERCDTDSIHDLRVASRRLRITFELFSPFLHEKQRQTVTKEIKRVTRALGHVRNIDEAILFVSVAELVLPNLVKALRGERNRESKAVITLLQEFPEHDVARRVRKMMAASLMSGTDVANLPAYLSEASVQRYQELSGLLAPAIIQDNVVGRHRLRIAIKKWRYLLEAVGEFSTQDYSGILETLKEYQTILGRLNDMVEFALLCKKMKLPARELREMRAALKRGAADSFEIFADLVSKRHIPYTFHL